VGATEETGAAYSGDHDGHPSFRTPRVFCGDDILVYTTPNSNYFLLS
jgi:hypothetical protein